MSDIRHQPPDRQPTPYLGLGFLSIIMLMASVALLGWLRTETLYEQLEQLHQEHALKLDRIQHMRSIVRERFIRMSLVASVQDPFLQEDYAREFDQLAGQFIQARADVERLARGSEEINMLQELRAITSAGTPIMVEVIETALAGQQGEALQILLEASLPKQERVMAQMDDILRAFEAANAAALAELARTQTRTRQLILLIAATAMLATLFIALYINRRIHRDRHALLREIAARTRVENRLRENQEGLERTVAERTAALRETTTRLEDAQRIAGFGHWDWDIAAGRLYWSDTVYRLFGHEPRVISASYENFLAAVYPDDRPAVEAALQEALATGSPYGIDYRIVRPDGEIRHVRAEAELTLDAGGTPQRMLGTMQDLTRDKDLQQQLWHLAHHDPLSGLPNRSLFADHLRQALERARRSGRQLALMVCDLDGFKQINDQHGHDAGDIVIIATARRLSAAVRGSDLVARLAGDEFTVLLENLEHEQDAGQIAHKILASVSKPIPVGEQLVQVGISIGIALFPGAGDTTEALLRRADSAMYQAKQAGRGNVRFAPPSGTKPKE
jgi:diguanylate cyclase (GGDEF)-like protein/PAS domain S-box-containing protein